MFGDSTNHHNAKQPMCEHTEVYCKSSYENQSKASSQKTSLKIWCIDHWTKKKGSRFSNVKNLLAFRGSCASKITFEYLEYLRMFFFSNAKKLFDR